MEPLMYIDSINSKKHLLLVCDDFNTGKAIEFHFIKRGLENDECCIYLTHGRITDVENDMMKYGVGVEYFKKKNLLHIDKISNPIEDPTSILDGVSNILKRAALPKLPFRIVGRIIPDVGMEEAISIQAFIEKIFHNGMFETLNGSILCTYDFDQIQANDRWHQWLDYLQTCHDATILILKGRRSVIINQKEMG